MRLTQQQVAQLVKVSRAAVGQWENGEDPSTENLLSICSALGIEVESAIKGVVKKVQYKSIMKDPDYEGSVEKVAIGYRLPPGTDPATLHSNTVAIYMALEPNEKERNDGGNLSISEFPLYSIPRLDNISENYDVAALALSSSVMEPEFRKNEFVYMILNQIPTVGDIILSVMRFPPFRDSSMPISYIRSGPAYIGRLEDFTPVTISIRQLNPSKLFTISTLEVGAMFKLQSGSIPAQAEQG